MAYKDKEKQREAQRESYRRRYHASRKFRKEEAERKAAWLQTEEGKEKNLAASKRHKAKVKKAERKPKPRKPANVKKDQASSPGRKRCR